MCLENSEAQLISLDELNSNTYTEPSQEDKVYNYFLRNYFTQKNKYNISRLEISRKSGLCPKTIYKIENLKEVPKFTTLIKLVDAVNIDINITGNTITLVDRF